MQPKITIIVPVYNVEKYLRECLDSLMMQTLRDIQIICVNDGSADGSRVILQEYADLDSRIEIIDKLNGGQSSARNAAYSSIKGKYTMFVDSDDWIDLDTCEKLFAEAEQTNAEIIVFFYRKEYHFSSKEPLSRFISPGKKTTPQEKHQLFIHHLAPWGKFWRSDFLLNHNLVFPEGLIFEDNVVSWQSFTQAEQVFVLPKPLYHYRNNSNGTTQSYTKKYLDIVPIHNLILAYLQESGFYTTYKDVFVPHKLETWKHYYDCTFSLSGRARFLRLIRESLTEDDRMFYRSEAASAMKPRVLCFYRGLVDGVWQETMKYYFHEVVKLPERLMKHAIIKPFRAMIENRFRKAVKTDAKPSIIPLPSQESGNPSKLRVA